MTLEHLFQNLLRRVEDAYSDHAEMSAFCPFPTDIKRQDVDPFQCNCTDVFRNDASLISTAYPALQSAIHDVTDGVYWRETYKETDIGDEFMDQFGCYCIIGEEAPFSSELIRLFMVYMPAGLYYPWHKHPAEEMYMVVSGNAVFSSEGDSDRVLTEGQTSFHSSNQPHAMETMNDPVLCLVAWRDCFETPPVLI